MVGFDRLGQFYALQLHLDPLHRAAIPLFGAQFFHPTLECARHLGARDYHHDLLVLGLYRLGCRLATR